MDKYFTNSTTDALKCMFCLAEKTINKTGFFTEGDFLHSSYIEWERTQTQPTPMMFLVGLYYELCKRMVQ